jgi:hypothetical protein
MSDKAATGILVLILATVTSIGVGMVWHSLGMAVLLWPVWILLYREIFAEKRKEEIKK